MKRVTVIIQFEAYVPEDMDMDKISEAVDKAVENRIDDFSIYVKDYPDEEQDSPVFSRCKN